MEPGQFILLHLTDPPERFWGRLVRIFEAGITIRAIGIDQIEVFKYQFKDEDRRVFPQTSFYPMRRVLKIDLDEAIDQIPSVIDAVKQTTGLDENQLMA